MPPMNNRATLAGVRVGTGLPVRIMGVINVSPESFFKKSVRPLGSDLLRTAEIMAEEGADILDIGAMSTAPYLRTQIPESEETRRLAGAIRLIRKRITLPISADTMRADPARAAFEEGADILNDTSGLRHDPALAEIGRRARGVILMAHPVGLPSSAPRPANPVHCVTELLRASLRRAGEAGLDESKIVLDPGVGFFRSARIDWWRWDLEVLRNTPRFLGLGRPLMVGISRKSFVGHLLGNRPPEGRLYGSLGATAAAVALGASLVRTHDVAATRDAVILAQAIAEPRVGAVGSRKIQRG
jgi:dihydropteroate synthase